MAYAVSVSLLVAYVLLGCYVLVQLGLLFAQKHNPLSYKSIFNWFALVWMLMRAAYWGCLATNVTLSDVVTYLLFWSPHCILYTTFATLALFLAKVINRRTWTGKYRNRFLLLYGVAGAVDVSGTVALSVLAGTTGQDVYANIESCGNAVLFLFLCGAFVSLSWRLRVLNAWEYSRMFVFKPRTLSAVAGTLALVFASRATFNFLTFSGAVTVDVDSDNWRDEAATVAAYVAWEFFPLILLLSTIAAAPRGSSTQDVPKEVLTFGVFGAIAQLGEHADAETEEHDTFGDSGYGVSETTAMLTGHAGNGMDSPPMASGPHSAGKTHKTAARTGGLGVSGGLIGSAGGLDGSGGFGFGVNSTGGLGRPGGFTAATSPSLLPAGDASDAALAAARAQASGLPPRPLAAAGFLSAQHNAAKRTMYVAPQLSGPGSAASPTYGGVSGVPTTSAPVTPVLVSMNTPSMFTATSYAYPPVFAANPSSMGSPSGALLFGAPPGQRPSPLV